MNPYVPGAGLRPAALVGRDPVIGDLRTIIDRTTIGLMDRSMILKGLRGVGKTVLLNEMWRIAREDGWITARVEGAASAEDRLVLDQVRAELIANLPETKSKGPLQKMRKLMTSIESVSLSVSPSHTLSAGMSFSQTGDEPKGPIDPAEFMGIALSVARAVKDDSSTTAHGVMLFIDEMQLLAKQELSAITYACHKAGQDEIPFYVIGAGLPDLPTRLAEARSYAERLFTYRDIDRLDDAEARDALIIPAYKQAVTWSEGALALVVNEARGYPYFLQQYGKEAWAVASSAKRVNVISEADAKDGITRGRAELEAGFYASRWHRATAAERKYMAAMALAGSEFSTTDAVASALKRTAQSLGPTRAKLIERGFIYSSYRGQIAFTVPGMGGFIMQTPEADDLKREISGDAVARQIPDEEGVATVDEHMYYTT
ncbi:MAG: ATP-binding protein [Acidimicrobiaceae bacterium]|nr:ATP-binding protein [Acidimicrobiaceae bacterium]